MGDRDERTLKMKEGYVELFNKGYTVKQIAETFGLSTWTVYHYLDEIAEKAGVPREALLNRSRNVLKSSNLTTGLPSFSEQSDYESSCRELIEKMEEVHDDLVSFIRFQEQEAEKHQKTERKETW